MKVKKIILFIVEGITDETCLGYILSRILNNNEIRFESTCGDITSQMGINPNNVAAKVGEIVKDFSGKVFKASDFAEIVHLVDMDGAYILDDQVVEKTPEIPRDPDKPQKPYYGNDQIFTDNIDGIRQRNLRKSEVLDRLVSLNKVWRTIPYSVYFFSCNLDHVLHREGNLFEKDKYIYAARFEKDCDSPEKFFRIINAQEIIIPGNYNETWVFIKTEANSLRRYTNFRLFFTEPKNQR